jgi:hypothetical protein
MMSPGVRCLAGCIFCVRRRGRSILDWLSGARASQAVAGEIDPVRVVNETIEDGVGIGWIADQLMPFVDGDLAGDDRRSASVALFENLEEVVTRGGIERFEPPGIEDEQLHAAERPLDSGIATIAAGERKVGQRRPSSWPCRGARPWPRALPA